jgi:acyl carrier protein
MDNTANTKLREFLMKSLMDAGDRQGFSDGSSLFVSGRLDSLAMTKLVMFLEESFDVDFGSVDFDVDMIDSLNAIRALCDSELARRTSA